MTGDIEAFKIDIAQSAMDDLRERLNHTRWPDAETVPDWNQGVPLKKLQALCHYWANDYDWRRCESMLNGLGQFRTTIDGLDIHFMHIRSPEANALPMIMTHGWPGSIIEFIKVIGPLTDPVAHGGRAEDAFHLVIPSLPGYGFSGKPAQPGWDAARTARAWSVLMQRLGYDRWVAQGGDWGSVVTRAIGVHQPQGCLGIHLNMIFIPPTSEELASLTAEEKAMLGKAQHYQEQGSGYAKQQSTRPQTLGYGLNDSPAGLAAWIYEKLQDWTDNDGAVETVLSADEMLDNISIYWLTGTATSSARFYWENQVNPPSSAVIDLPTGISQFPGDLFHASRRWAERAYSRIMHWNEATGGGHFAAWERPDIFASEVSECFRTLR